MNNNGIKNKNPIYDVLNANRSNSNNNNNNFGNNENKNFSNINNNNNNNNYNNNFINNTMNMNNINTNPNFANNMNSQMNNCMNNIGINNMNNNFNNCFNNGINFNNSMMNNQNNFCNPMNGFQNNNNNNNTINFGAINNNNTFNNNTFNNNTFNNNMNNNNTFNNNTFNNNMNNNNTFNNNIFNNNVNNNLQCNNINNTFNQMNMNFPNNMNIMQNNLNFNNFSYKQTQTNFNNNQLCNFYNPQLQNSCFFNNNNMFNNFNFNFNNNYFQQSMQNMLFQQMFYKFMLQQNILNFFMNQKLTQNFLLNTQNLSAMPKFDNLLNTQSETSQNKDLLQDLLDILREPNIQAKNDQEIIEQFSAPELLSNDLTTEIITEFLNLDPTLLNGFGNKLNGNWARNEMRGGLNYNPPIGWVGFGLNVINKYDDGNNDWLACDGRPGEWCVGYHGTGRNKGNEEVKNIIKSILRNNLQPGGGQGYKNDYDKNHPFNKVGVGVYCSPDINVLEEYAGFITVKGKKYKVGIMVRCKRDKIRIPRSHQNYWVLDGNFDQLRPYRLLIKEVNNFQMFI